MEQRGQGARTVRCAAPGGAIHMAGQHALRHGAVCSLHPGPATWQLGEGHEQLHIFFKFCFLICNMVISLPSSQSWPPRGQMRPGKQRGEQCLQAGIPWRGGNDCGDEAKGMTVEVVAWAGWRTRTLEEKAKEHRPRHWKDHGS